MSEPFIGEIRMFGGNFAPRGWALCDGRLLEISGNAALFSILGTIYGGDGRVTFGLPDLRGRFPMNFGTGPGLTPRQVGQKLGAESTTLDVAHLPPHGHSASLSGSASAKCSAEPGDRATPVGNSWAPDAGNQSAAYADADPTTAMRAGSIDLSTASVSVETAGGGQAFDRMPPFQVVNFIIALQGLYPSRS